ncbi:unnamed protein product [Effrenium voratum]|nr:unnamed protein product [Effrenium voratum]
MRMPWAYSFGKSGALPAHFADHLLSERERSGGCGHAHALALGLDCLNFDAKSEQTFAGITKEFGHMIGSSLQSSKWHRRAEALKSMMQVLQGMDLQGMAPPGSTGVLRPGIQANSDPRRWRLTCQLLNQVMRDKVMPVRLASLELFEVAFGDLHYLEKAEVAYAAGVLVEHLIDRLGDSNLRLHEAARRAVVFTAQKPGLLGLKEVISRLRARLGVTSERTKVHFGVLDTVSVLLDTVGEAGG